MRSASALPLADVMLQRRERQLRAMNKLMQCNKRRAGVLIYSMTSSARASSVGGISRPSALAVLRLITSSNLVGCSTGRSAGLAPFRILST